MNNKNKQYNELNNAKLVKPINQGNVQFGENLPPLYPQMVMDGNNLTPRMAKAEKLIPNTSVDNSANANPQKNLGQQGFFQQVLKILKKNT